MASNAALDTVLKIQFVSSKEYVEYINLASTVSERSHHKNLKICATKFSQDITLLMVSML